MKTTRRDFLTHSSLGIAGLFTATACAATDRDEDVQEVTLFVSWIEKEFDGLRVKLRSYNRSVPGPTITTRGGQRLYVRIINELSDYAGQAWTKADTWNGDHNVPHLLSHTNLHLHGLDVIPHLFEPVGTSNPAAPMISIAPDGGAFTYSFILPYNHPCGLFWYHPHHHGSTVTQAVSGMAGPIVVEGPIDDVPEIAAATTYLLAIQDIGLFPSDDPSTPDLWTYEPVQNSIWQTFGGDVTIYDPLTQMSVPQPNLRGGFTTGDYKVRFYLANGEPFYREDHNDTAPTDPIGRQLTAGQQITAAPGEVFRVRLLNGSSDLVMPLYLEGHVIHLLAMDGVNFGEPRPIATVDAALWDGVVDYGASATTLVLAPANRAEFLVKAGLPGVYQLIQLAHSGEQFLASGRKVLATITVRGEPNDMPLPLTLPLPTRYYPLIDPAHIAATYSTSFSMRFPGTLNPVVGLDFMVDDNVYQEATVEKYAQLGSSEEWTVATVNTTEGHPFHIHVNHFEAIVINGVVQPPGTILDTVWIPKPPSTQTGSQSTALLRMRYLDWVGKTVFHCHILPHEDTGMMKNFAITY
jgi:FtsP/CotA-like multicopper oxidase with cupredoxin domain